MSLHLAIDRFRNLLKHRRPARGENHCRRRPRLQIEMLDVRILPSTVIWSSTTGGSWNTASNWNTHTVPKAGDDVIINQPGNLQVALTGSDSVNSIAITGDMLKVVSGTLTVAANSSLDSASILLLNNGNVAVAGGATLTNSGTITNGATNIASALLIAGTLSNPGTIKADAGTLAVDATGSIAQISGGALTAGTWDAVNGATLTIGSNQLANADFASPGITTSGTTPPSSWNTWGSAFLSNQFAYTGTQSVETFGANSGVNQSFAVNPGTSYTASVYAMTPSTSKLSGSEMASLAVIFFDGQGNQISSYTPPNDVAVLTASSATGGPLGGTVGGQGWNYFTTAAVAPANAATVQVDLGAGAFNGTGAGSGTVYWDDPRFGATSAFTSNQATLVIGGTGAAIAGLSGLTTNSGSITVQPGARLNLTGNFSQAAGSKLTLPAGSLVTGVGTNLLTNSSFESPTAANSTTPPDSWPNWGSSYVSTQYALSGAQSLVESGANSGVLQSFPATPGVSYTGTVDAMTPSTNKLTGPEGAFLQVIFDDAQGNQISPYSPPNSVTILTANSAAGGPITGSVGNQGWNYFTTTAVAPSNAATVNFVLETGAYTGLPGSAGGAVYWDNAEFGPTATKNGMFSAANISNSGLITIGADDVVTANGSFTQTTTGTLAVQLGGPAASGQFGALNASGSATLAGRLQATLVNGYTPSINDGFNVVTYAGLTGTFTAISLPSSSTYAFKAAVNPTYTGVGAVPTTLSTTVNANTVIEPLSTNMLGVNLAWWDDKLTTAQTQQMVKAAGLKAFRFPGGSSSDDFHFNVAANYNDPVAVAIPQFAQFIQAVGGTGLLTLDYGSGSPQEAAAELAYLEGSPTNTTSIGTGIEWNDSTNQWQNVNWQTVGYWASLRAASPLGTDDGLNFLRINHAAAFSGIKFWEVGNEEYGSWEIDHHGTAGPGGVGTGAQHDPATYAAFAKTFANFAAKIAPSILIGIDSGDPTNGFNDWTKNVLTAGLNIGFIPSYISDHSYMYGFGQENDTTLLEGTVSNPNSVLDWSTRYADYHNLLQTALGAQAGSVQVMATEFNSTYATPGKQSTSLVNGLFIADSIGGILDSGYTGGFVWDLRNGWSGNSGNNSPSLYGWRQGGDYGLLGDPDLNDAPSTGAYIPYPNYFAEQLASKIVLSGGQVVSASSSYQELDVFAVKEANGHLVLFVINKNPDASIPEQFALQGFQPSGQAQIWRYSEVQDYAQSQSTTGAAALAHSAPTLTINGSSFTYAFPAYSMTVIDLTPAPGPAIATATSPIILALGSKAREIRFMLPTASSWPSVSSRATDLGYVDSLLRAVKKTGSVASELNVRRMVTEAIDVDEGIWRFGAE
jgi:alpha-L-arabinofuranosidase